MAGSSRSLTAKFDGDTSGLARAAKDGDRIVEKFGRDAPEKFRQEFDKGWGRRGVSAFKSAAHTGLSAFGTALQGGVISNPAITKGFAAAVLAAIVVGLPAVGAVAGGALVLGFGAGLAGLGLMTAAKSQIVKDTWKATLTDMGSRMSLISKPFETTLLQIATIARRTFGQFEPVLADAFKKMAPAITGFANHFGRALGQLVPAIGPITDAFTDVLALLGPATVGLVGNISRGFADLAAAVSRNPGALADLTDGIGKLTGQALGLIATLSDVDRAFQDVTGGVSTVEVVMVALSASVSTLDLALGGLEGALRGIDAGLDKVGIGADEARLPLVNYAGSAGVAAATTRDAARAMDEAKRKAKEQAQALEDLFTAMFRTSRLALTLSGSQIGLQAAIDDATASMRANGRTLDINTEKGRANRTALNGIASAANSQTEAMIRAGGSHRSAATAAENARRNFVRIATQMGLSRSAATALARSLINIPNVTRSVVIKYSSTGVNLTTPSSVGRRQHGGPTTPGQAYLVGERGPELHVPRAAGNVVPNHQLTRIAASLDAARTGGGGPLIVENHIEIGGEVVRVVRTEISDKDRRTKRALTAGAARGSEGAA